MRPRGVAPERALGRFVSGAMVSPYTLPILGGSLLAATALGIHLGESSVGLINPIYFQGPAVHPRDRGAAIDESRLPPRTPAYGELYGWESGSAARAADCGDCEALRARAAYARDYSAEIPYFGGPAEPPAYTVADVEVHYGEAEAAPAAPVVPPKLPVVRYAYYPVVAEETVEAPQAPPDEYYPE